ncbi:uncharacterized protein F5147DRAFT_658383 [Suillus discolor]|uniref:Uncharacterized protein n=1 Tax=Suillus discolor TaxID=1912936 RepID=A0A9P7JMV7_9AGAM|nr:uncharacterized protein F5147DRAFT_658383 [Suillus discolor]KAG2089634.1 hypothetical protein F5147DRAFT_658383 [Suillus discolor]
MSPCVTISLFPYGNPIHTAVAVKYALLIVKCLRYDRLLQSTALFVLSDLSSSLDWAVMVANEVPAATRLTFVSLTSCDASYRVENLTQSTHLRQLEEKHEMLNLIESSIFPDLRSQSFHSGKQLTLVTHHHEGDHAIKAPDGTTLEHFLS